jgi:uncharacterized paraquat-inducible protein A
MDLNKWKCKECDGVFFTPREKRNDTDFCPYCYHACLFNVTYEKELEEV